MRQLKYLLRSFFAISLLCTSCEKNDEKGKIGTSDNLEILGILGQWKLESREINGISSLAVECCDYIEFETDNLPNDLNGLFRSNGLGYETNGVFQLDSSNETIEFTYNGDQKIYDLQIVDTRLVFKYLENNDSIVENWLSLN